MVARFDDLESELRRRRDAADYLPHLQEMFAQSGQRPAPPPQPWMRRPGSMESPYRQPQDPSVDTFDQRFDPTSPRNRQEWQYPVLPGTRERFLDPTKVIASAAGQIPAVGKNPAEQPYPVELPPGFKFVDEEAKKPELPPGFKFVDEPSQSNIPPGVGSIPEDPFERAALRTTRAQMAPRAEGTVTRAAEGIVPAIGREAERLATIADVAMKTGDLPPQQAMEIALMANPASAAYKTGMSIARAARTPAEAAQIETGVMSIPRAAEAGQAKQALGRAISAAPVGGGRLREAAERSTQELITAGEAAAARPTGIVPTQNLAGSNVRRHIGNAMVEAKEAGEVVPKEFKQLLTRSNEDMIGRITQMAADVKQGANINALAKIRSEIPTKDWANVQGALIHRMGQSPRSGEFDPKTWLTNYGNLSDRGKNVLFGYEGKSSLRTHLDAIESVSRRAPSWQQFQRERSSLGSKVGAASLIGTAVGATFAPLTVLGTVVPMAILARSLAKPATAAPIAQWSRAYERVIRSNGAPQAMATFTLATRNLNNNLGTDIDPVAALRGPQNGQPVE